MNNFRKIMQIYKIDFRKLLHDSRLVLCTLTLALLIIGKRTDELRSFCSILQVKATPFPLFVIITETLYNQKLILLLFLMLICDAPFIDGAISHCMLRTGRVNWFWGTLIYISKLVMLFWLLVFLLCIISIINYCEWSTEWGRVFLSIMRTGEIPDLLGSLRYAEISSAFEAFLMSFSLKYLLTLLLALITWLINVKTGKNYGIVLPIILVLLHGHIVGWFVDPGFVYISPVSLSNLNMLNIDGMTASLPSVRYAYLFLIGANLLLCFLLWRATIRFTVETNAFVK